MRRWLCLVLVLILLCSGCTLSPDSRPTTPTTTDRQDEPLPYAENWAYRQLSELQKENYGAVYTAVTDGFEKDSKVSVSGDKTEHSNGLSVALPHPLATEKEVSALYNAVMQDNPAFFHIGGVYGYDGRQYGDERRFTALKLTYTMSAEKRIAARSALEKQAKAILDAVDDTATAYDKELALHDALCARCTYDNDVAVSKEPLRTAPSAFTAYGALVEGKAVCEGYARAMQYLLNRAGIAATVVSGKDSDGHAHMWNALYLDDELYYLDATWNDDETVSTYSYFNINSEQLSRTHQLDDTTLGLTETTATAYNYYHRTGVYLDTLRLDEIASTVAEQLSDGRDFVHLRFSAAAFSNALLFVRSASWFTDTVNAYLPSGTEPIPAFTVVCDEKQQTVTICKKIA